MSIKIKFDNERNIIEPVLVLMNRNANKIGTIPYYSFKAKINLNSYSELSFVVDKNSCSETLWDNLVDFKLIWVRDWNLCFEMYVDTNEDNSTRKMITANSLGESELSQINLYDIEINTETDISRDDYVPTILYNNENHNASLMHRITEKCPHYTIGHVDSTVANIQRTFAFNNQSIYDSLNKIADEIGCIFIINCSLSANGNLIREINIYDLERSCLSCGYRDDSNYTVCPKCGGTNISEGYGEDTTIFVSSKNLAEQISFTTDTGSVKNCFRLVAGDDLMSSAVISCNPNGGQYLWYISQEMRDDMPSELVNKIDQYLELCEYYQNEYSVSLSSSWVNEYNSLIQKYSVYTSRFNNITLPIVGSSLLMENLYNVLDFDIYLKNEMMPTPEISNTTAAIQAQKLTAGNLSPVSVTDLSSLSLSTANNAVLGIAKVLIDNRYKVSIVNSTLSNNTWQGSFNVTNYSNEEDTATSNTINIVINDNYENFLKQKIDKALEKSMTTNDPIDIISLFKLSLTNFKNEIKKYSLSILKSFYDNCETCLNVLIEQGVANSNTWVGQTPNLYNTLYIPYRNKLTALEQETKLRETEISKVERIKNALVKSENTVQSNLDLASYMGETLWKQFAAYRREDTYQNDNYISDGLNNTELFEKANAFIREAQKNIYKSANLQHSISTTLKNLLLMKEFEPIVDYFEVGNWIRVKVDNDIYKLRLIGYEINLDPSNSNLAVEFSDVIKVSDGLSDIQSILAQSKSISSSYSSVKRQAESGNEGNKKVKGWINDGIALNNIKILEDAENQNIQFDNNGLLCREYLPLIDDYSDQQLKIINKGIYLTDDKWNNAKVGIGEIEYNGTKYYGVNGEILIGNIIMGNELHILDNQGREIFTVVDGKIHSQIQDNNENYVDGHIADSAASVKSYADTQITQTADRITSEANARLEATVGYSSKNVLAITANTLTDGGLTFTVNKEAGTVKVNGTCTAENYKTFVVGTITNTGSGDVKYYLSGCANGGASDKYYLYAIDSTVGNRPKQWDGITTSLSSYNLSDQVEILIPSGNTVQIIILVRNGQTLNNLVFKPMVRDGSISDKTFEPYKSIQTQITETNSRIEQTADSITSEVSKRIKATVGHSDENLLVYNQSTQTINGITFTIDKDAETIKASGTATADAVLYFNIPSTVYGNLYFSGCPDGGSSSTWDVHCWDNTTSARPKKWDGTTSSESCFNKNQAEEIKLINGNSARLGMRIRRGKTVNNLVFEPSITKNKSLQADVYETNSKITQTDTQIRTDVSATYSTKTEATNKANAARDAANSATDTKLQNYSTTTQMSTAISQTAGEIAMSVTKSTLGYSGKNLLKITGVTTTVNGITFTVNKSAGTVTATGTATADASLAVARGTDLPTGDLYLSGGGSSGSTTTYYVYAYDYTVDARPKKWDGTTQSESSINTASNVEVKLVSGHDTAIRIMVREGVTVNGKVFKPMLRYGSIVDSTFEPWVDNGAKICSQISMTDEQISLTSGRLLITSGNFKLNSSGTATMTNAVLTGGTIKTSNYAAASGSTKTVGGEINLNATGSALMFDTAGFKVAGNGVCTIGGSSVIQSDNYVSGTSGMKITLSNGKIDSKNFKIDENGSMTSTSGSIGRWTISSDKISQTAGGYTVNLSNYNTTSSASHFIACIDGNNNTTFAIERSGMLKAYSSEIRIGEDAFQQLRCQAGHIDFYYNNIKSGRIGQTSANNICVEDTDFEVNKDFICKGKIISDSSIQGNSFKLKAYPSNNAMSATTVTLHGTSTDVMHIGINQNSGLPIRILSTCTYMSGDLDFYNNEHGIIINNAYAFRWTNGALYCGIDSKSLRLVGSSITANGSPVATTSDARVKRNISELDNKYLDVIKRLKPRKFMYNDDISLSGRTHTGYIAQELKSAIDDSGLTTQDVAAFIDQYKDGKEYAIRYEELIPLLHEWIRELDRRINTLEGKEMVNNE